MAKRKDKLPVLGLNITNNQTQEEKVEPQALPTLDLPELDLPELDLPKSDLPNVDLSNIPEPEKKGFLASLWGSVKSGTLNTIAGVVEKSKTFAHAPAVSHGIYGFDGPKIRDVETGELRDRTPEENKAIEVETEKFALEIKAKADSIQSEIEEFDQGIWDNIKDLKFLDATKQLSYAFANTAPTMAAIAVNPYAGISTLGIGAAGSKELELREEVAEGAEYTEAQIQASSWAYGGAEIVGDILMGGLLKQSGRLLNGMRKSGGDEIAKSASKELAKTMVKGFAYEGSGEGATQVLQNGIDKYVLDKDVSLTDGLADAIITGGFISGNTIMGSYLMGKALSKLTPQNEQEAVKNNTQKIQSLTKSINDPTISESQKDVIRKAKDALISENNQVMSEAKDRMDEMSNENKQTVIDNTNEINQIDEVLKDPSIDSDTRTALTDVKSKLQENINEILQPEDIVEPKTKKDGVQKQQEVEETVDTQGAKDEVVTKETQEDTGQVQETEGIVIPAETLSKANESFKAAQENLSDSDAAQESFKTVERSEWYQALPKDQQTEAKAKFLNEIAERFPPKPVKSRKTKVQEVIDRFVKPSKGKPKKVTVEEYGALKDQIRLEAKAAKAGAKSAVSDVSTSQGLLLDYMKTELYDSEGKDVGKSDLGRLLSGIKSATSYKQLGRQINKVDNVISKVRTKALKRQKSDVAKFVSKKRTTQISGKIKARAGDVFTIPYFQKASGVIKSLQDITSSVKKAMAEKYPTAGLSGRKLIDQTTKRDAEGARTTEKQIDDTMNKLYDEALDKLVNGPEHTVNRYNAELQAIEDFRNFESLNLDNIQEFSERMKALDKAGKAALKQDIAAEAIRLRELTQEIDESIATKSPKEQGRVDSQKKSVIKETWDKIRTSPKDFFNFVTRPTTHLKTMLELMSTQDAEVGKGTIITKLYKPISNAESNELGGLAEAHKAIKDIAIDALGADTEADFANADNRMNETMEINTNIEGVEGQEVVTKGEAMSIYAWSRTPELAAELKSKNGISDAEINRIKNEIGTDLIQFVDKIGDWLSTTYADRVNDVYRDMFRIDFSGRQDYHPVVRVKGPKVDITTDSDPFARLSATMASALKERVSTDRKLQVRSEKDGKDVSFLGLINNHIQEMEHFMAWAKVAKDVSAVLSSDNFKARANERLGKNGYQMVSKLMKHAINKDQYRTEYGLGSTLVSAYGIGVLGAKIKQLPIQLTSMVTGSMEYQNARGRKLIGYNTVSWAKEVGKLAANPMYAGKVFAEIMENNPKIRARVDRGSNLDPDFIKREHNRSAKLGNKRSFYGKVQRLVMAPTLAGDVGAIMYGYAPIYVAAKAKYMNEGLSEAEAIKKASQEFDVYEESQQTRSALHLSQAQLNASFGNRIVTTFKSSNILFLNQTMQAVNSIMRSYRAGGVKNINKRDVKRLVVYHSLVNMAYQFVASGVTALVRGDDESFWEDQARAAILGNLNALFVAGDILDYFANQIQGKNFSFKLGILPAEQAVIATGKALKGDEKFQQDWIELMYFFGSLLRVPVKNVKNTATGFAEFLESGDINDLLKAIGYSEYGITGKQKQEREKDKKRKRTIKRRE